MAQKKQKWSCYAIHYIDSGEDFVVKSWAECQKKTTGHNNKMKGFQSEAEAREWLASIGGKKTAPPQKRTEKAKTVKQPRTGRIPFQIKLERQAANDLQKKAAMLNTPVEFLLENLVLEYLYDM